MYVCTVVVEGARSLIQEFVHAHFCRSIALLFCRYHTLLVAVKNRIASRVIPRHITASQLACVHLELIVLVRVN